MYASNFVASPSQRREGGTVNPLTLFFGLTTCSQSIVCSPTESTGLSATLELAFTITRGGGRRTSSSESSGPAAADDLLGPDAPRIASLARVRRVPQKEGVEVAVCRWGGGGGARSPPAVGVGEGRGRVRLA